MVGGHGTIEARLLGYPRESQEFGRRELLMRGMKANAGQESHSHLIAAHAVGRELAARAPVAGWRAMEEDIRWLRRSSPD
jgi:hypothetical protein